MAHSSPLKQKTPRKNILIPNSYLPHLFKEGMQSPSQQYNWRIKRLADIHSLLIINIQPTGFTHVENKEQ